MARLFGQDISRETLRESVGDMAQVCGIQSFTFNDGAGCGVRALEFRAGGGLRFIALPDRAMDIYMAEFRGVPLNWLSGTGPVAPAWYSPHGWDWLRSFFGGLLTTCGLSNVGDAVEDKGAYLDREQFGAHGRISNTPARCLGYDCGWEEDTYVLFARGEMVETAGQGEKLVLRRELRAEMGRATIEVHDTGAQVLASCRSIQGLDPGSESRVDQIGRMHAPDANSHSRRHRGTFREPRDSDHHRLRGLSMSRFRISAGLWILDTFAERYVPTGYHDPMDFERQLEMMSRVPGLDGLGIVYPTAPFPQDPVKLVELLARHNLELGDITVENSGNRKWRHGPFATSERDIRKENIRLCKEAMDFAALIPGTTLTIWPAHDGFDYPFQSNYADGWRNMTDALREVCAHNSKVRVAIEYKQKDPRQRQYVSNVGKAMMHVNDIGTSNACVALDTGHGLMSQENLAESAVILSSHGRLGTVHLNDNYRDADPDMIFGAVAFWDNLELYYWLKRMDYQGWHEIDITSPRDDREKSARLVVKMARLYERLAEKLVARSARIEENVEGFRFADNMDLITDILFP